MKKIVIAFDGTHFSDGAFEFVRRLNEISPVFVVGSFLPQPIPVNAWTYAEVGDGALISDMMSKEERNTILSNIEKFDGLCNSHKIKYAVHKHLDGLSVPELLIETAFADLLILSGELFYKGFGTEPNGYMEEILRKSDCPVLIVPEKFDFPCSNILAYDGSAASVYAIKQFSYLFPMLCTNNTLLLNAGKKESREIPNEDYIEELLSTSFKDFSILKVEFDPKTYLATWLSEKPHTILVAGAYGRPLLSEIFNRSFVENIIAEHELPIFIAHK